MISLSPGALSHLPAKFRLVSIVHVERCVQMCNWRSMENGSFPRCSRIIRWNTSLLTLWSYRRWKSSTQVRSIWSLSLGSFIALVVLSSLFSVVVFEGPIIVLSYSIYLSDVSLLRFLSLLVPVRILPFSPVIINDKVNSNSSLLFVRWQWEEIREQSLYRRWRVEEDQYRYILYYLCLL